MTDTFTFPNTPAGREQRSALAAILIEHHRNVRAFEETWSNSTHTTTVLRLEVSKRPAEGLIARAMKGRKQ